MTPMSIADTLLRSSLLISGNGVAAAPTAQVRQSKRVRADRIGNDLWTEAGNPDGELHNILHFDRTVPARLPFDNVWIEWALQPGAHDGVLGQPTRDEPQRITDCAVRLWSIDDIAKVPADMRKLGPANAEHAIGFDLFAKRVPGYGPVQHIVGGAVFLDADYRHLPNGTAIRMPRGMAQTDKSVWVMNVAIRYWVTPALQVVAFMNCRNITLVPVDTNVHRSKKAKPEKIPRLEFHTIRLPRQSYASTSSHNATDPAERARHLVRGHFKTYTADAPLLGKAVGTYWWGWQARGSKKNGIVISDYEVKASA